MNRLTLTIVVVALAAAGLFVYFKYFDVPPTPQVSSASVTTGDITEAAIATGTLSALRTVDVGSQVSGIVQKLYVDFNSIVHKGQLLAQLDPSTIQQDLESAKAAKQQAEISLKQQQDAFEIDQRNMERAVSLRANGLNSEQDRELATLQVEEDKATIKQAEAAIAIAQKNIEQAQVNLSYTTITSPIDGVVIARNVDEGQTVAARMNVPTLFSLATDLTQLHIVADVDESDVSRIRAGQVAAFTVDAYPGRKFLGNVDIVRLNATSTNNVVTYQVVASVPNPDLRLMPGMTATINIEIFKASDVLRVPSVALRFRPSDDDFAALAQPVPPEAHVKPSQTPNGPSVALTSLAANSGTPIRTQSGSTIDTFFKPPTRPQSSGQVWVIENRKLEPIPVQLGITDGTWTELTGGSLQEGDQVITTFMLPPGVRLTPIATATPTPHPTGK